MKKQKQKRVRSRALTMWTELQIALGVDLWWVGFYGRTLGLYLLYAFSGAAVGVVVTTLLDRAAPATSWAWAFGLRVVVSFTLWGALFWLCEQYEITVRRRQR